MVKWLHSMEPLLLLSARHSNHSRTNPNTHSHTRIQTLKAPRQEHFRAHFSAKGHFEQSPAAAIEASPEFNQPNMKYHLLFLSCIEKTS